MNITQAEYRQHPAISRSELQLIGKTPLHYLYSKTHPQAETESLVFGAATHKYILEADTFFEEFAIAPDLNRRTKEGKEAYQQFIETNSGKDIISQSDFETIKEMAKAVEENEVAKALLEGEHEQSFFWTDYDTGVECKCRPDCLSSCIDFGIPLIVDYKTTSSCANYDFERSCRKYGYKLQAGMYTEGMFQNTMQEYGFAFVAQEKTAPYAVRVYICTPEFISEGRDQFRELLGTYKYCEENNDWYGYEGPAGTVTELYGEDEHGND